VGSRSGPAYGGRAQLGCSSTETARSCVGAPPNARRFDHCAQGWPLDTSHAEATAAPCSLPRHCRTALAGGAMRWPGTARLRRGPPQTHSPVVPARAAPFPLRAVLARSAVKAQGPQPAMERTPKPKGSNKKTRLIRPGRGEGKKNLTARALRPSRVRSPRSCWC
jgi:hypothetical protein